MGVLATSFNAMAAQVGGLLQGLKDRTRALETEVTVRGQTEEALTQSVARYRMLFEQASDGIFVSDVQGNFLEVNPSGCRMLGYTHAELLQLTIAHLIPAEDLARDPMQFDGPRSGQAIIKERRVKRKDGSLLPVEVRAQILPDGRLQAMIRDITEPKRAEAAVREERGRLARELHDSVTQSLYSATLFAEAGWELAEAQDLAGAALHLRRIGEVVQQALKELRLLVHALRPPVLEQLGLVRALQQRLDTVERRAGMEARLLAEDTVALPAVVEDALYHMALEGLNNALKHAQATSVRVQMRAAGADIVLEIVDNGRGFDPNAPGDPGGLGLLSMRERADKVGATLSVQSAPGKGTVVQIRVGTAWTA